MKNLITHAFLFILLATACLFGCKKNSAKPKQTCEIATLVIGSDGTSFTYDSLGRVTSRNGTAVDKFTYSGNNIIFITHSFGTAAKTSTTVTLNQNGLAVSAFTRDSSGNDLSATLYEYTGTELIKATVTSPQPSQPLVTTYGWQDGNLTSIQNAFDTTVLSYSASIPAQTGDFWDIMNLVQGYPTFRTKNALTAIGTSGNTISYGFDETGKITTLVNVVNGTATTINYEYDCH